MKNILSVLIILLLCISCNRKDHQSSAYFNNAIDQASQIFDSGNAVRSLRFIDSAYNNIQHGNALDQYHYYNYYFNVYYKTFKNYTKAQLYADSMLAVIEQNGETKNLAEEYAQANFLKGDVLFKMEDFKMAYKYYYKAKILAKNNLDLCTLDDYTYRLGMVLFKQNSFAEAIKYYQESFSESQYCDHNFTLFYRQQELLNNIGLCFYNIKSYDSAIVYYQKSLALIDENFNKFPAKKIDIYNVAYAVVYGNLASVYIRKGENDKAEALLNKSISINSRKGSDAMDAQYSRIKLADIYLQKGDMQNARRLLNKINNIMDTLPGGEVRLRWYNLMWKYYYNSKQPEKGLEYLLYYNKLRDSEAESNKKMLQFDMNERLKSLDEQYQIAALEKRNEIKQVYLIIACVTILMALIIVYLIYQNWRKSVKNIHKLTLLNNKVYNQKIKLEDLLKELEAGNKEKDKILKAVAHDIRNPIAAISSLADLLSDYNNYSEDQVQLIEYIKAACVEALALNKDILEATAPVRPETMSREWIDINVMVTRNVDLLRFVTSEKNQQITLNSDDISHLVFINKEKMGRAINNLISNAMKFSARGSVINVNIQRENNGIQIAVHDKGIGIPDKIRDKVFDVFTEAKRLGTAGERPFGLGLSITKQIIEAHGGKIWFNSKVGVGTSFYILLPNEMVKEKVYDTV